MPPNVRALGRIAALMPTDVESGGSWIGVNERGVCACLLNGNPHGADGGLKTWNGRRSRGDLVPELLACESLDELQQRGGAIPAEAFPAFRLVAFDLCRVVVMSGDGERVHIEEPVLLRGAFLRTSSGLGDALVEAPRRELFESMFNATSPGDAERVQDVFHAHFWPGEQRISVLMSRDDARTVSRTTIELDDARARMRYEPIDERGEPVRPAAVHELVIQTFGAVA